MIRAMTVHYCSNKYLDERRVTSDKIKSHIDKFVHEGARECLFWQQIWDKDSGETVGRELVRGELGWSCSHEQCFRFIN